MSLTEATLARIVTINEKSRGYISEVLGNIRSSIALLESRQDLSFSAADSVLNRTPMGKRTEVVIDGYSPTQYLTRVQTKSLLDDAEFDTVLGTHELNVDLLQQSDFPNFLRDRRSRFVGMVEYAMGKPVVRDVDDRDYSGGEEGPNAFSE